MNYTWQCFTYVLAYFLYESNFSLQYWVSLHLRAHMVVCYQFIQLIDFSIIYKGSHHSRGCFCYNIINSLPGTQFAIECLPDYVNKGIHSKTEAIIQWKCQANSVRIAYFLTHLHLPNQRKNRK